MISLSLEKLHSPEAELAGIRHYLENSTQHSYAINLLQFILSLKFLVLMKD